jgi:hypothetical protein
MKSLREQKMKTKMLICTIIFMFVGKICFSPSVYAGQTLEPPTYSDYEWYTYNGHQYAITLDYSSWAQAETWAQAVGGHLVTINDSAENAWLTNTFAGYYCRYHDGDQWYNAVWIGFHRVAGQWGWVSDEPVTFQPPWWYPGPTTDSDYAYLHAGNHPYPGTWWNSGYWATHPDMYGIIEISESPEPLTPVEQIEEILNFIDDSVMDGTLVGEGKGNSAANKLNTFIKQLELVQDLIEKEFIGEAIDKLLVLYKQADGQDKPKDHVIGNAVIKLSDKIKTLIESLVVLTGFEIPEDTWGQENPIYSSGINAIDKFLAWSPVSGRGSCYAIATLELRWYKARRDTYGLLPRLRTVYDTSPCWVQDYAVGILQNVTILENVISILETNIENGSVSASGVATLLKAEINLGNPVLVIQKGEEWNVEEQKYKPVGHAVVAFGYSEDLDNIYFLIADSNCPDDTFTLTYNKNLGTWDYYWSWSEFKVGAISLLSVCN